MTPTKLYPCKTCGRMVKIRSKGLCPACRSNELPPKQSKPIKVKIKPTGELELFESIWTTRERICFVTWVPIAKFDISCFAHVLRKSQNGWPLFKLNPKNIILVTPEVHYLLDFGTEAQREKFGYAEGWAKLYALREELKEEYTELLKQNKIVNP